MNISDFNKLLTTSGIRAKMPFDPKEKFIAEIAFLNRMNRNLQQTTGLSGFKFIYLYESDAENVPGLFTDDTFGFSLELSHKSGVTVTIVYAPNWENPSPDQHGVAILDDDMNLCYCRYASQGINKWSFNDMANDPTVTDEKGKMLFEGDPVNM